MPNKHFGDNRVEYSLFVRDTKHASPDLISMAKLIQRLQCIPDFIDEMFYFRGRNDSVMG